MKALTILVALPLALSLAGCAGQTQATPAAKALAAVPASPAAPAPRTTPARVPLNDAQKSFIAKMAAQHGFDTKALGDILARPPREDVLKLMTRAPERSTPWYKYRQIFITDARIAAGTAFWREHAEALTRAERDYGVPAEVIAAIIGVETFYGRIKGKHAVLDALNTLAFHYPPRAPYFTSEMEAFLLLARAEGWDYAEPVGSYAGAMGYGQFMPSNYRTLAVDFDGDGHIDLLNNPVDAIGSVAHYLKHHGWQVGASIRDGAYAPKAFREGLKTKGYKPHLDQHKLKAHGVTAQLPKHSPLAAFVELETAEGQMTQWLTYQNFYVITRYNRSPMYAMAVTELSEALRAAEPAPSTAGR